LKILQAGPSLSSYRSNKSRSPPLPRHPLFSLRPRVPVQAMPDQPPGDRAVLLV